MRLYTLEVNGNEVVAVETKAGMCTLEMLDVKVQDMNELICKFDDVRDALASKVLAYEGKCLEETEYKLLAPITIPRQDIICLGVNYHEHIEETADIVDFTEKKDAVYFSKRVNKCNNPDGNIPCYDFVDSLDYEVELAVILKKDVFQISKEDVSDSILGYSIINDVSARNVQLKHQQWYLGKSLDGYTPMGPCIVTADELKNADNLGIGCYVNDEMRQKSNTRFMITSVEEAIVELSQGMTLKKGTIIATGTPGGVGMGMNPPQFLKAGDKIRCEIEGIGELRNTVGPMK